MLCGGAAPVHRYRRAGGERPGRGVLVLYASPHGRALIDRRLLLPAATWCADTERCAGPGSPTTSSGFRRDQAGPGAPRWSTPPSTPMSRPGGSPRTRSTGANTAFRTGLRERGVGYVLAVAVDQHVSHRRRTRPGRRPGRRASAAVLAATQRRAGLRKGPRDYDWAWVGIDPAATWGEDDRWLLIRRHRHTGELAYYLCWAPSPVPLRRLVRVAGARWAVEESFQAAKARSGRRYQVRSSSSRHRRPPLAMLALAILTVLVANAAGAAPARATAAAVAPAPGRQRDPSLLNVLIIRHRSALDPLLALVELATGRPSPRPPSPLPATPRPDDQVRLSYRWLV